MALISAPIATAGLSALLLATTFSAQSDDEAANSSQVSKVRIVRLSEVKGAVLLDRDNGRGFEDAIANLPIVENSRLQTGTGIAEIEFEDNSTMRLAPDSVVVFPQLERLSSGSTVTSIQLVKGMAYVSLLKTKGNEFNLLFGQQKLQLPPASRIRLKVDGAEAQLAVLDGTLRVDGASGPMDVPKKKTAIFSMTDQAQPKIARDTAADPYDAWDQESVGYHARTAALADLSSSPYSYGLNDMGYYGSFITAGGCGSMWRPYFASAAWDPYSNGSWSWYSGAGYSWVSPYPWGWTPYHFGSWSYCAGTGWGWLPGGSWYGLNNAVAIGARTGPGNAPQRPVSPPRVGEPTTMAVNLKPLVRSEEASTDSFVFRKDSAGLGVPRETLGKLDKLSQRAEGRGAATVPIYLSAASATAANGRTGNAAVAPTAIHRGSPPPAATAMQMPGQGGAYSGRSSGPASSGPSSGSSRPR
jgi:hypothetical protein